MVFLKKKHRFSLHYYDTGVELDISSRGRAEITVLHSGGIIFFTVIFSGGSIQCKWERKSAALGVKP